MLAVGYIEHKSFILCVYLYLISLRINHVNRDYSYYYTCYSHEMNRDDYYLTV